ncbi:MAG: transcription elongation factor GreA, partial [Tissierellia bacterium]|nr:transcription elongation factor GreA [Tissierellia bacterium]
MSERDVFLTEDGLKKLESELDELKTVRRKEIAERIKQALSFGDISENSEYDQA